VSPQSNPIDDKLRVMIVEDDRATREGLAALIGGTPGFAAAGQFRSVEDALKTSAGPDVILLDIHLAGMSGSRGVPLLAEKFPAAKIVMLTVFDGTEEVFESICNGACGYLLKKTPPAKLIEAISEARNGGAPMTPEIAIKVVELFREFAPGPKADCGLTAREQDVLALLAEGFSYTGIGARLGITANTVRNYIRTIYEKLQVHSRSEAVSKALRRRLI
jgi:DNA-binding NarL/FixJ family response regulator